MKELKIKEVSASIASLFGYEFNNEELLLAALTHKSYVNENPNEKCDNQRLEFLGDAVLSVAVAEMLMEALPDADEGELTSKRSVLVREETLAQLARNTNLGSLLRLGRGEEISNGRDRASTLADALEALVGAIHLDGGFKASKDLVVKFYESKFEKIIDGDLQCDMKTCLQEALQARNIGLPNYRVIKEEGPDHAKVFEVEISVGNEILACGRGRNKKTAEKEAAKRALEILEVK